MNAPTIGNREITTPNKNNFISLFSSRTPADDVVVVASSAGASSSAASSAGASSSSSYFINLLVLSLGCISIL